MPNRETPASWQVIQVGTAAATVVWPATLSVDGFKFAVPILKPLLPGVTFAVVWQPEPLQSSVPAGGM